MHFSILSDLKKTTAVVVMNFEYDVKMHFSILSDLKKTTAVVESLSTTSTKCSVTEITSLLQDLWHNFNIKY